MQTHTNSQFGWLNLLVYWTVVTAVAGVVAYLVVVLAGAVWFRQLFPGVIASLVYSGAPLGGAAAGLVAGGGQWLALRHRHRGLTAWILATLVGWSAGLFVTFQVFLWLLRDGLGYTTLLTPFLLGGLLAGASQLIFLRRLLPEAGWWWLVAAGMGWAVGWIAALGLAAGLSPIPDLPPVALLGILGGLHGAFIGFETGLALVILLRLEDVKEESIPEEGGKVSPRVDQDKM